MFFFEIEAVSYYFFPKKRLNCYQLSGINQSGISSKVIYLLKNMYSKMKLCVKSTFYAHSTDLCHCSDLSFSSTKKKI